jgi:hypothetical protein
MRHIDSATWALMKRRTASRLLGQPWHYAAPAATKHDERKMYEDLSTDAVIMVSIAELDERS